MIEIIGIRAADIEPFTYPGMKNIASFKRK